MIVKLTQAMAGNNDGGAFALRPGASHECSPREAARLVGSNLAEVSEATGEEKKEFEKEAAAYRKERQAELAGRSAAKQPVAPPDLESETDDEDDGPALTGDEHKPAPKPAPTKKKAAAKA